MQRNSLFIWLWFLFLLLTAQSLLLWIDHHPMFFLGDSESYVWSAISEWLPSDRSFVYGYFIRLVAVATKSLVVLVMVQVVLSAVASIAMAYLLIRYFRIRPWIAFIAAFLTSLEPLQLLYARYVMTETLALAVFILWLWVILHYLEMPRIKWLYLVHGLAVLLISIRFAFVPLIWACSFILPILAFPAIPEISQKTGIWKINKRLLQVVASVFILLAFTSLYNHLHGYLQKKPPAYTYDDGFYAMGFAMPILEPGDFTNRDLGEQVMRDLPFPRHDRKARNAHRWHEDGAVSRLQKLEPDLIKANAIARQAAVNAIIQRPFAFLHLGWLTLHDYFDPTHLESSTKHLLGDRRLSPEFHNLLKAHFNYSSDQSSSFELKSLCGQYLFHSGYWIQFLLVTPLGWGVLFGFSRDGDQRRKIGAMVFISLISLATSVLLTEYSEPRYLHTTAWLFFLMAGIGLNRLLGGAHTNSVGYPVIDNING